MRKTLSEIAQFLGGELSGDKELLITGLCSLTNGKPQCLAYCESPKYQQQLNHTQAAAVLLPREIHLPGKSFIRVDHPARAFWQIAQLMASEQNHFLGIHPTAVVASTARLGSKVALGPHVVIDDQVEIGEGSVIYAGSCIGAGTKIGNDCLIYPNVVLREGTMLGSRVVIFPGAVIGGDGFGYATVDGKHEKIPQVGIVIIEDDVEVGANVAIDRARFGTTVIGARTKIDNLVHIAHNVTIGSDCLIVAQVGIAGSVNIGRKVILGGQAGVIGHLTVGDGVIGAAQTVITKSVPNNQFVLGNPHRERTQAHRVNACLQRLPKFTQDLTILKSQVTKLEQYV